MTVRRLRELLEIYDQDAEIAVYDGAHLGQPIAVANLLPGAGVFKMAVASPFALRMEAYADERAGGAVMIRVHR